MPMRKMDEIRDRTVGPGEAVLWRMGQSGFMVKTCDGLLCMDLYLSPNPMRTAPSLVEPEEIDCADIVFGSHDHPDHIDRNAWPALFRASPGAAAVVPACLQREIRRSLLLEPEQVVGLEDGKSQWVHGMRFYGVASAHELLDQDPVTGLYPCMGAVIETQGIRIYQPGDTCLYEGLAAKLRALGPIDVMILPINGRDGPRFQRGIMGNMTFQEAADLAGLLGPRLVIPAHYDLFKGNLEDPFRFTDYLSAKYPKQAYWVGELGESILYSKRRDG